MNAFGNFDLQTALLVDYVSIVTLSRAAQRDGALSSVVGIENVEFDFGVMIAAAHFFWCTAEAARLRSLATCAATEELFEKVAVIATTARIGKLEVGIPIGRRTETLPVSIPAVLAVPVAT